MINNVGIDIVDNERFIEYLDNEKMVKRLLSIEEYEIFNTFTSNDRKLTFLCGRFCAKEALIKAINKEDKHFNYSDLSILNDEKGAPYIKTNFSLDGKIHLSIAHSKSNTTAIVIYDK